MKGLLCATGLSVLAHACLFYWSPNPLPTFALPAALPARLTLQLTAPAPKPAPRPAAHQPVAPTSEPPDPPAKSAIIPASKPEPTSPLLPAPAPAPKPITKQQTVPNPSPAAPPDPPEKPVSNEAIGEMAATASAAVAARTSRPGSPADVPSTTPGHQQAPLVDARPRYRYNPKPTYPAAARKRHQQGTVLLSVVVDKTGQVSQIVVSSSSGSPLLDRAAVNSVRQWLFDAGHRGQDPVESTVTVPIRFELK